MKLSEMRKLELLNKLVKCLTVPAVIIVLLFSFDILKFNGIGMVILFCVCFITLFIVLVMIANILHKNFKIKKASNLIECNKFASFFAITTDGVNYELNQKIKKKDRKKRVNTIYRLRCFF
ncbi:hypothetical protein J2B92_16070 [Lysinibacillus sphaericus]|uniref:hypothetical protein n=1 Tax=Lysinibacillus sphaericus TaxID=1421 RepID=UPI0018CE81FB|nr:hypothetical protein [Lysinibacillus sphaericus]MBG9756590.1 hypothetical protein [Lysinibacillus sphaericus]QTB12373.1 hypothetical protein J2B92_16070 [Lysinibacillus sphaericus]